jgi:hypothetical protein
MVAGCFFFVPKETVRGGREAEDDVDGSKVDPA